MIPAILFEPDGYVLSGDRLMGRQSAGEAFLRALVQAMGVQATGGNGEVWGYTPHRNSAEVFGRVIRELDGRLAPRWCRSDNLSRLAAIGGLYIPGPDLPQHARLRAAVGHDAYSLTGITHTTASHRAMDTITDFLAAPVMPWDALICTSTAVVETVRILLSEQAALLRWRFGKELDFALPLTPMIPLGVHLEDFARDDRARAEARAELGIEEDAVVMLYAGRLSFHAKAHPHAMYLAAERVAQETGRKLVLIQSGWFANEPLENAFRDGAARYAPNVACLFTDGRKVDEKARSWAAADIFLSLSDNVQETFGLTPVEAMAAGLPTVVTDWNGYKDTIRDGIDGFRITTHAPAPGAGAELALRHAAGVDNYDFYCGLTCQLVSVEHDALAEKLKLLVIDPDLRRKMGEAGLQRAREVYDWRVVFNQYRQLWDQQARMRAEVRTSSAWQQKLAAAPRQSANRLDPFLAFGHYPSGHANPDTLITARTTGGVAEYQRLTKDPLFSYAEAVLPSVESVERVLGSMQAGAAKISLLVEQTGLETGQVIRVCAVLSKMGIAKLS